MVTKEVRINNEVGLHLKIAGALCREASKFHCNISMKSQKGVTANLKSLLSVVALGVKGYDTVIVECSGPDEEAAMETIVHLLEVEKIDV